jgi:hypothetical protein
MPCSGHAGTHCGGDGRMTVYSSEDEPVTNPGVDGFVSQGCYNDTIGARALETVLSIEQPSVATCTSVCKAKGFKYSGLEYGVGESYYWFT